MLAARVFNVEPEYYGANLRGAFSELGGPAFTQWLRALTGVDDLVMDPQNVGGGLHRGSRGSQLYVHADHNTHPNDPARYRRFNVLVYLTPTWNKSWGGELELWNADSSHVVQTIEPRFNRCVIMEVHDRAFHGYRRLRFPAQETRDSIAAYYYSDVPSAQQTVDAHPTVFGVESDASRMNRTVSHVRRVLLKRFFPSIQNAEPPTSSQPSTMAGGDVGQRLVEAGQDGIAVDLEQ